jgi:hypothetical protein
MGKVVDINHLNNVSSNNFFVRVSRRHCQKSKLATLGLNLTLSTPDLDLSVAFHLFTFSHYHVIPQLSYT